METIQELKNQLAELQEKIEKLENKKENKRWKAESGEEYFFLDCNDEINSYNQEYASSIDAFYYKTRNYFKTEEEAKEYQEKVNTYYELMDFAEELSKDNPVDWNNVDQRKLYIFYSFNCNDIIQGSSYTHRDIGQIYCTDYNFKEKAIEKFGKEKLKKLNM